MRPSLILNPAAGSAPRIRESLSRCALRELDVRETQRAGDAARMARELRAQGRRRILVGGGDGLVHEVVTALAPDWDDLELALVPAGTANDLARSLDVPVQDTDAALRLALEGPVRRIDLVRIDSDPEDYFVNAASGGFGGEIAQVLSVEDKRRWGPFAYWMSAASKLVDLDECEVDLSLDQRELHVTAYGVELANGRFVGGGFPVAPNALLDDGLLDVTVVSIQSALEALTSGLDLMAGREGERLAFHRAKRIEVRAHPRMPFTIDGEPKGALDLRCEVLPRVLPLVTGENPRCLPADE